MTKNRSTIDEPVAFVWATVFENIGNEDIPRADVLRICIDAGVTPGTAKTQFQRAKHCVISGGELNWKK